MMRSRLSARRWRIQDRIQRTVVTTRDPRNGDTLGQLERAGED